MATLKCDFTPRARAEWVCSYCQAKFCDSCIPDGTNPRWGKSGPRCVLCHSDLSAANDPALAPPFWHQLPYFFLYAMHPNALIVTAIAALGVWLTGSGLAALVFLVLWSCMTVRYFFDVIAERARGRPWPPSLLGIIKGDPHYLLVQLILVHVALAAMVVGILYYLPYLQFFVMRHVSFFDVNQAKLLILGVALLITFCYPVIVMVLAVSRSMFQALNPVAWITVISALGIYYLLLWVLLILIGAIPAALAYWWDPLLPDEWVLAVNTGMGWYFAFVSYALLGYTLFQYSGDIGLDITDDTEEHLEDDEFARARLQGAVHVLVQRNELEQARDALRELVNLNRDDIPLHQQYHALLKRLPEPKPVAHHTDYLAALLIEQKRIKDAAALVQDTLQHVPDYHPTALSLTLTLAPVFKARKQSALLVRMLANAHKRQPMDPLLPEAYLLLAELLAGVEAKPDKARQLVMFMLKQYPDMSERKAYEKLLARLNRQLNPSS